MLISFLLISSSSFNWFSRTAGRKNSSLRNRCSTAIFTISWLRMSPRQSWD